ncbi:uncharacterized protein [Arachis hypogaea]|uniref:uncharacterized protein isoform X1 n=1 Tax=Arachis hypogaea TaxID=3818 RepID=UPI000DECCE4D|nr:uncharacterized protein LOC112741908 [Arachis hypogaea]
MNLRSHTYYIGMRLKKLMVYGFTMKMNVKKLQISLIVLSPLSPGWQAKLIFNSHQIVVPNFHFHCSRRNRKPNNHQSSTLLQRGRGLGLWSVSLLILALLNDAIPLN